MGVFATKTTRGQRGQGGFGEEKKEECLALTTKRKRGGDIDDRKQKKV